ncbi:hypothetical protein GLOTRDRAFT_72892 [Gloeophyllum trabeum ATCC 11539]|uniref:PIN domain-containing protein n=1 Tax=Gloeophyllum trabeum (strain ATCC 11539 / FP-39264 / Madison 617) TaxID=670483 RepID=S7QGB9_GLOTA|nr:uncharacterized protein GLOTRDRAFT_72892 [Gloeophyllum trabeum ATCC 11539]EPQ58457.1 hypothetical protein GLOTRDRAFT_72892 [Gloeophyllum trabeum ATCC 11539]
MSEETSTRPSRKGKERELREGCPTDLAQRIFALQRTKAAATKPRERAERPSPPTVIHESTASQSTGRMAVEKRSAERPSCTTLRGHPAQSSPPRKSFQSSPPRVVVSNPSLDREDLDFSRRLKISHSPRPSPHHQDPSHTGPSKKLFNPHIDPIPMRRTAEPESISDSQSNSSSHNVQVSRSSPHSREPHVHRQLFDHRKDDPVRFSVLVRPSVGPDGRAPPTPKSSGDYVSASSTSSYAHSLASSSFTLSSSTTDGSSTGSALFDQGKPSQESSGSNNTAFSQQLKKLYRAIAALEDRILHEDDGLNADDGLARDAPARGSGVVLKARNGKEPKEKDEEAEQEKWRKVVQDHKLLAEMMHNLLEISLAPSVPSSLRNIPEKYKIIIRLWTHGFHKLLESLRRSSWHSLVAFEHLQDFIYYAYTFYTGLLEERTLDAHRLSWLEALGDLARYRMVVTDMAMKVPYAKGLPQPLTVNAVSQASLEAPVPPPASKSKASISDKPAARIDDSESPSIGLAAARAMDVEPEKERWRGIAREWYATALAEKPVEGKLHHHMGLLCREVEGEELRAVYHFVKGMTTLHPFQTSRESILPLWSVDAQARRALPDARVPDLFVLLQGMLFTNIQLDDFGKSLDRFLERLELDGAEEREWIMMAVVNIGGILEYGRPGGVLRKTGVLGLGIGASAAATSSAAAKVKLAKKEDDGDSKKMDVDEDGEDADGDKEMKSSTVGASPALSEAASTESPELPLAFRLSLQLTFSMLSHALRKPTRKTSVLQKPALNPYITIILTFLATLLRHETIRNLLERALPWEDLATFYSRSVPTNMTHEESSRWAMLTSSCRPLPEDWCIRGMEWVGRKVFERGFWLKIPESDAKHVELEVLERRDAQDADIDGIIEEEDDDDNGNKKPGSESSQRWVRAVRAGLAIAQSVDGFGRAESSREWIIGGSLSVKVQHWKEEERLQREEQERRRQGTRWGDDDLMDVDDDQISGDDEESDEEDEEDSDEVKALKARRRYLRSLLSSAQRTPPRRSAPARAPRKPKAAVDARPSLKLVPGYSVLVVDTNILLSSLSVFQSLVESMQWTIVVPLPVIMELDGLSGASDAPELSGAASSALSYIISHLRSHSTSLKILTSKGNYMTTLSVRSEQVDFDRQGSWERNMDDLILRAAIWQDEHWVDRSAFLKAADVPEEVKHDAVKVVLLSLDRNLRLKARAKQLHAAHERDLAAIFATATT